MNQAQKLAAEKFPHDKFPGEKGDSLRFAFVVGYVEALKYASDVIIDQIQVIANDIITEK